MNDATCTCDLDELDLVDFPRRATWRRSFRSRCSVCVDALLRTRVVDVPEIDESPCDIEPCLFKCLTSRRLLELLVGIRCAFRDAPRCAAVVVARRMHEEHLDRPLDISIEQGAR